MKLVGKGYKLTAVELRNKRNTMAKQTKTKITIEVEIEHSSTPDIAIASVKSHLGQLCKSVVVMDAETNHNATGEPHTEMHPVDKLD